MFRTLLVSEWNVVGREIVSRLLPAALDRWLSPRDSFNSLNR